MSAKTTLSKKQLQNIVSEVYKDYPEKKIMLTEGAKSFQWSKLLDYSLRMAGGVGALYDLSKKDSEIEKIGRWMTDTLGFPTTTEAAEALGSEMGAFWVHSLSKFDLAGGDQDYKEIEQQQAIQSNRPAMRYSIRIFDVKKDAIGAGKQLSSLTGTANKIQNPNWKYISEIGDNSRLVSMVSNAKDKLSKEISKIYSYAVKKKLYKQDKIERIKEFEYGGRSASLLSLDEEEKLLMFWKRLVWQSHPSTVKRSIESIIEEFDFEAVDRGFRLGGGNEVKVKSIDLGVLIPKTDRETLNDFKILHSLSSFMEYAFSKEVRRGIQKPPAELPRKIMNRVGGFGDLYEALLIRAIPPLKNLFYEYAEEEGFLQNGKLQFNALYENPFTDGVVQSKVLDQIAVESKKLFGDNSNPSTDYFVVNKSIANKDEIKKRHELAIQAAVQVGTEIAFVLALGPVFGALGAAVKTIGWVARAPVLSKMLGFSIAAFGIGTEIGIAMGISKLIGETVNKFQRIVENIQEISNDFIQDVLENPAIVQDLMASYEDPEKAKQAEKALEVVENFEKEAKSAISDLEKLQASITSKIYEVIKTQASATGVGEQDLYKRIGLGAGEGRFDAFQYNKEAVESSASQFISWHKNPTEENKKQILNFFETYISIAEVLDKTANTMREGQQEMASHLSKLPPSTTASKEKVAVNEQAAAIAKGATVLALPTVASELLAALGPKGVKDITSMLDFERYMLSFFNMRQDFTTNFGAREAMNKAVLDTSNIKPYMDMKMKYTKRVQDAYKKTFRERHAATLANKGEDVAKQVGAYLFRPHIITVFNANSMPNWNKGKITFSFEFFDMKGVPTMSASTGAYRRFYLEEFQEIGLVDEFLEALRINSIVLGKVLVSLYAIIRLGNEIEKTDLKQVNQQPVATSGGLPVINIKQQDAKEIVDLISKSSQEEAIAYLQSLPEGSDNKNRFLTVNTLRMLMIDCMKKITIHKSAKSDLVNSAALAAQSLDKLVEFLVVMRK